MQNPERLRISLDGAWQFRHQGDDGWRVAQVPGPWQAQFQDLWHESGRALYRRSFAAPAVPDGIQAVLRFGAVSYIAEVRVNGTPVGRNEGGYLPFDLPIPAHVLRAENEVEVAVLLPDGDPASAPEAPFAEIPHGKQSWYGPLGGIWQSVALELRAMAHLDHCAIAADPETGLVTCTLTLSAAALGATAEVALLAPSGAVVATGDVPVAGTEAALRLQVAAPLLWSPDSPALYQARVTVRQGATALDITQHSFGFRSFTTRNGQMFLNGAPFYMRAALDQDYYPEGICTPPSVEFLEDQFRKARELGLNMLRCHIKIPDPRYYEVADRTGMLIWTEIPNVATFTDASARRMRETMEGMLKRDGNHPSIVIWTLINEDWGTRLIEDPAHRAWLAATYDWLRQRDPSRLVCDNSPCHGNFHVKGDLDDFHYYRSVPERREEWDALTAEFAAGANWTWSPHGDGQRRGDEPRIVSEMGVWGLPDPALLRGASGAEPFWMETGGSWGDGVAYPHGVENRFAALRLGSVFGSFDAFIQAAQGYQFANLKYEIEVMRSHAAIQGYVITELTDVHWESNGLLDMNRNPRSFHDSFATINADRVIVPRVTRYAGTAGEVFRFGLDLATGGLALPAGCRLTWSLDGGPAGAVTLPATPALALAPGGEVALTLPATAENRMARISLALDLDGKTLAGNSFEIALFAPRKPRGRPTVAATDSSLASHAAALGYTVLPADQADVILTHALDAADIRALQSGRRYLVLADGSVPTQGNLRRDKGPREQPFIPIVDDIPGLPQGSEAALPNINLIARHGTIWRGDWIAGFSWLRRKGAFAALPGGPLLDLAWSSCVPRHVLTGFRTWEFGGPVHAGLVVGWVHKPAALIAERKVGRGALLATTFRLRTEAPGADPVASALFDALTETAAEMATDI